MDVFFGEGGQFCVHAQSWLTFYNPMGCSPPDSAVHENFQARYWSALPFPTPEDLPDSEIKPTFFASPALAGGFFTTVPPRKPRPILVDKNLHFTFILICLFRKSFKLAYSCSFSVVVLDFIFFVVVFFRIPLIFQY